MGEGKFFLCKAMPSTLQRQAWWQDSLGHLTEPTSTPGPPLIRLLRECSREARSPSGAMEPDNSKTEKIKRGILGTYQHNCPSHPGS